MHQAPSVQGGNVGTRLYPFLTVEDKGTLVPIFVEGRTKGDTKVCGSQQLDVVVLGGEGCVCLPLCSKRGPPQSTLQEVYNELSDETQAKVRKILNDAFVRFLDDGGRTIPPKRRNTTAGIPPERASTRVCKVCHSWPQATAERQACDLDPLTQVTWVGRNV